MNTERVRQNYAVDFKVVEAIHGHLNVLKIEREPETLLRPSCINREQAFTSVKYSRNVDDFNHGL